MGLAPSASTGSATLPLRDVEKVLSKALMVGAYKATATAEVEEGLGLQLHT